MSPEEVYIVDVGLVVNAGMSYWEHFQKELVALGVTVDPITKATMRELINDMIEDYFTVKKKWCPFPDHYQRKMAALYPWHTEDNPVEACCYESFTSILLREIKERFECVKKDEWSLESIRHRGNDVYVTCTGDFRVLDWTRRVESGEWKL